MLNMRLRLVYLGFPETLLLGTKLAQILFDKYISFLREHFSNFDRLCKFTTKFTTWLWPCPAIVPKPVLGKVFKSPGMLP
jgi:hypothetical protein